jgi:hypothetical protein
MTLPSRSLKMTLPSRDLKACLMQLLVEKFTKYILKSLTLKMQTVL